MGNSHRTGIIALMIVSLLGFGVTAAAEEYVVVPGASAGVEGLSTNIMPFSIGPISPAVQEYQQVYSSKGFAALNKKLLITQIAFRPNAPTKVYPGTRFDTTLANVTIKLSTTTKAPGGLIPDFSANFGSDVTVVHSGPLPLSSSYTYNGSTGAGLPKDFDVVITLGTPFPYDPAQGNLLMYVWKNATESASPLDAVRGAETAGETSRVYYSTYSGGPTAEVHGLVTRFTVKPAEVAIPVVADLKPGNEANKVNTKSRGTLPVAIFSTSEFDAKSVDITTLTVAGTPVKSKPNGEPMAALGDINGDGLPDLMVHVDTEALLAGVGPRAASVSEGGGSTVEASLEGKTLDGTPIKGTVSIQIVK